MATQSKKRKKQKSTPRDDFRPRMKTSRRIFTLVAAVMIFALVAGMIAMGAIGAMTPVS